MESLGDPSEPDKGMVRYVILLIILLTLGCTPEFKLITQGENTKLFVYTHHSTNVYLLANNGRIIMIDAGYAADSSSLFKAIEDLNLSKAQIEYLIITHGHNDHLGPAQTFRKWGAKVVVGEGDSARVTSGRMDTLCPTSFQARTMALFSKDTFFPSEVDIVIRKGRPLSLPEWGLVIEQWPGHTAGSLVIHSSLGLFVGDMIRGKPFSKDRPNRHYYMCNLERNTAQIDSLMSVGGDQIWYPGHFGPLQPKSIKKWIGLHKDD